MIDPLLKWYYQNEYTLIHRMIVAFIVGFILSPFAKGVFWYILFFVCYEIFHRVYCHVMGSYWCLYSRLSMFFAGLFGLIVSRTLMQQEVLRVGKIPAIVVRHLSCPTRHPKTDEIKPNLARLFSSVTSRLS